MRILAQAAIVPLLAAICSMVLFTKASFADIPVSEREGLIALYESTGGDAWMTNEHWLGPAGSECSWYGITCDAEHTHVLEIALEDNGLDGHIPPEIGSFLHLERLSLGLGWCCPKRSGDAWTEELERNRCFRADHATIDRETNHLVGGIPPEIGRLEELQFLNLGWNALTGPIPPEISSCTGLTHVDLSHNQLSGTIPEDFASLRNLEIFHLKDNPLSEAPIPDWLSQCSRIEVLGLEGTNRSGPIPPWLGTLSNIRMLFLASNKLTGEIPAEIGNLTPFSIYLDDNMLTGPIPEELFIGSLYVLDISDNRLSGPIPVEIEQLGYMLTLSLASNALSGPIPVEITHFCSEWELDLSFNALYASDPSVRNHLDLRCPGWDLTQTVPPHAVRISPSSDHSVAVTWQPILYSSSPGYYEIFFSERPDGPYSLAGTTDSKWNNSFAVDSLPAGAESYFRIRTVSLPQPFNQNELASDPGDVCGCFLNPVLPCDCDSDYSVSIGEVQHGVNMFLSTESPSCGADGDGNGTVSLGELQKAFQAFLSPCSCLAAGVN